METSITKNKVRLVAVLALLSWLGAFIHTWLELRLSILSPENSFPAIVGLTLFLGWWRQPGRHRLWARLLFGWTAFAHLLVGSILSVIPLPLWPFYPAQSAGHYVSHLIYGLAQLPLIWVLWSEVRR